MNRETQFKVFTGILIAAFALLFLRLVQLQLVEGYRYFTLAQKNAAKVIPIMAPRGIIYDRYGKVLVANRAVFAVYILPSSLPASESEQGEVVRHLSRLIGFPADKIFSMLKQKRQAFEPLLVKDHLALDTVVKLEERRSEMPGVVVRSRPVRYYPNGKVAAHVLGFVGEIEVRELQTLGEQGFKMGDYIGKGGVEKTYDAYLRGIDGGQKIEVNVYGRAVRVVSSLDPVPGSDLKLTIDLELQKEVEKLLSGHPGASIVLNPDSGEILALASWPDFNPRIFTGPLDAATWARLRSFSHPFMNRALSLYPPGSTFKVVTLSAALEDKGWRGEEVFYCPGFLKLGNRLAKCWRESGHGSLTILEALVWSCDVAFYQVGLKLGEDLIAKYAGLYGFGKKTGIDLPGEGEGLVPSAAWKKAKFGVPWFKGDTINFAIGQGYLQVTPLQLALCYATLAAGERFQPYVVSRVISRDNKEIVKNEPVRVALSPISRLNLEKIKMALAAVVRRGTGRLAYVPEMPAGGKTGTAENPGRPHAWFVCFAPPDHPRIVIVNFIEHGEHGDQATARLAGQILAWYKEHRLKNKFPAIALPTFEVR